MNLSFVFLAVVIQSWMSFAMTYKDNDVLLPYKGGGGWTVLAGVFTATEGSITQGQDPDNLNKLVMQKVIKNDKMTFRVGRSKSSDVAQWFARKVLAQTNTFNKDPKELNFAFFGSLTFSILGNDIEGEAFNIQGVTFAQGSSGSTNNWWFGGQTCRHQGDYKVLCRVTRKSNPSEGWEMEFRRGGDSNPVDTVEITAFRRTGQYSDFTNSEFGIAADGSGDLTF